MAIFNSYVKLPEGKYLHNICQIFFPMIYPVTYPHYLLVESPILGVSPNFGGVF